MGVTTKSDAGVAQSGVTNEIRSASAIFQWKYLQIWENASTDESRAPSKRIIVISAEYISF